ncbi:hypothetical protein L596_002382 [Steinernema carpocapsae]|uniref:Uncharacterized protein n=1 Tax=Steinernema carpocapsae TaxID=34508 RepID=A0A4U8UT08_STECR|nr:hypothetical protein L596_002382 [Steinernema carpocapsae]
MRTSRGRHFAVETSERPAGRSSSVLRSSFLWTFRLVACKHPHSLISPFSSVIVECFFVINAILLHRVLASEGLLVK